MNGGVISGRFSNRCVGVRGAAMASRRFDCDREIEMKRQAWRWSEALVFCAVGMVAAAADHMDSPITKNDPSADINDLFTFINPNNANELILIGTYVPNANFGSRFSDAVDYRFHIDNG